MHKNKINNNPVKEYTYDACSKLIQVEAPHQQITQSQWDYEDRLIGVTYPNQSTNSFGYNPFGARVSKSDSSGASTYFRAGTSVVSPVLSDGSATYTPGISERRNNNSTYYHSDLKNTVAQTASNETISGTNVYDAFGNLLNYTGDWNGPFAYGGAFGYQTDDDSGLMLLGHRYYDPSTGRFLSRDPIGDGSNWYSYCRHNPVVYFDEDGQVPLLALGLIFALVVATPTHTGRDHGEKPQKTDQTFEYTVWGAIVPLPSASYLVVKGISKIFQWAKSARATKVAKATVERHAGFKKQVQAMSEASKRKSVRNLERRIAEHEEKLLKDPKSRDAKHWKKEIETFKEQLEIVKEALNE